MGMSQFRLLVESFCKQAGLANSESIIGGNAFSIHACLAWLQYLEHADLCRITLELGQPESGIPSSLLRMMLEFNCANESRYLPSLGINPINGNALLMLHTPVANLDKSSSLFELIDVQLKPVVDAWSRCFDAVSNEAAETPVLPDRGFV